MGYFQKYTTKGEIFFSSDTHISHKNIVRGTTSWRNEDGSIPMGSVRNFDTIEDMNETIIKNFNDRIGQDDLLFLLGDVAFGGYQNIEKFLDRLTCKNVSLIYGNHDQNIKKNVYGLQDRFMGCMDYREINLKDQDFVLCHYPLSSWHKVNKGVIHLHGHVHLPEHLKFSRGKKMDCGVDGNNLKPYHIDEIIGHMKNQPILSDMDIDHHLDRIKGVVG
jgi:calcineurin-like phosphoesterase family protein